MLEELKLTIELVPLTSWGQSLKRRMLKSAWDVIRRKTYAASNHKCGICAAAGELNCHEVWEFNDRKHLQKLIGFIALCGLCHHVKHVGLAEILSRENKLNFESVVKHFCKVNGCDRKAFEEHRRRVFALFHERSAVKWKVDLGEYASLVVSNG